MPNSKVNQHCFNCAHWQGYAEGDEPTVNNGECRRLPRIGKLDDNPTLFYQYWPYVEDGNIFWCSCWKLTRTGAITTAASPRPAVWPDDWSDFHNNPWNVKIAINQSCWNCNHFQRDKESPVNPGENTGECRKLPGPPVMDMNVGLTFDTLETKKFQEAGSAYCCSCWEFPQGTVPPDPGYAPV